MMRLSGRDIPSSFFSFRQLKTFDTRCGVLLPAWISASRILVYGGNLNGWIA